MPSRSYTPGPPTAPRSSGTSVGGRGAAGRGPRPGGRDGADGTDVALPVRGRITVQGVVERITVAPVLGTPTFSVVARIGWHGTPRDVRVIWLGQRRVPGIEAGVALRFEGMLTRLDGTPTVYNPRYEIIGRPEEY